MGFVVALEVELMVVWEVALGVVLELLVSQR